MTIDQALALEKGAVVTTPHTVPAMRPIRVTDVWINPKRTIVLVHLAGIAKDAWLDATGYDLPEPGTVWCLNHRTWETTAEHRRLHPKS